jgi:hypothetical protein
MKAVFFLLSFIVATTFTFGQAKDSLLSKPDPSKKLQVVEAACGECQLGLHGKGCNLAVRIDGKSYFVDGAGIDSFGDAHAADGFCNAIRKAEVQGIVKGDRFQVSYFKLISAKSKEQPTKKKTAPAKQG